MSKFIDKAHRFLCYSIKTGLSSSYLQYRKFKNYIVLNHLAARVNLKPVNGQDYFADQRKIIRSLAKYIDRNYCLLDLPDYNNIGDHLICKGSLNFLNTLPHKKKYAASIKLFNPSKIDRNDLILLQGGGNFGDLWPKHQNFREYIVKNFRHNKIIILPQTIYFQKEKNMKPTVRAFSNHPDLTICVRDWRSYERAKNNFTKNKILLIPDMASYLSCKVNKKRTNNPKRVLFMKRRDKELKKSFKIPFIKNLDTRDWPSFKYKYYNYIPNKHKQQQLYLNEGILLMANYDIVISTRLHGSILSVLLDIPTIILDNIYGKNKTYYDTWLNGVSHCYFAHNKQQLLEIISRNYPELFNNQKDE